MPSTYGSTHETAAPIPLSDEVLLGIGRLVRAFAEIEELLTLFISALAKINQSQAVIMLSRAQLSRRLSMAEQLATLSGGKPLERYNLCFGSAAFKDAHTCRNVMAHGIYLGVDSAGMLAFLTDKTDAPVGASTMQLVACYQPETILSWSKWAAENIEPMAEALGLKPWLKRHQPQPLLPHRKGRLPKGGGVKQKTPPKS